MFEKRHLEMAGVSAAVYIVFTMLSVDKLVPRIYKPATPQAGS